MIQIPCIRHSCTPKCLNASSTKCSHLACSACCIILSNSSPSSVISTIAASEIELGTATGTGTEGKDCSFHLEKQRKEKEKQLQKKFHAHEKKRLHKERNAASTKESERVKSIRKEEKAVAHLSRLEEHSKQSQLVGDEKVEVVGGGNPIVVD